MEAQSQSSLQAPRLVSLLMRLVVGAVFIFSGFVKAVDPWGGFYKITDYLQALGWDGLLPLALFAAFAVAVVEFVLGVLLAAGAYRKLAPWLLLLIMLFMTPLTLWLAVTDAVADCGCFGDALHLSNWATFGKNLFITLGLIYLLRFNTQLPGVYGPAVQWIVGLVSFAFVLAVAMCGYLTQPLIDYRPYEVGTRLVAAQGADDDEDDYVFIYERDGEQREFTIDSVPDDDDSEWTFVQRHRVRHDVHKADALPTASITMMDDGFDVTAQQLAAPRAKLLLLMPDLEQVGIAYTFVINELCDFATNHGAAVWALTGGTDEQKAHWREIALAEYPLYSADDSEIKMMARGNPAVLYVDEDNVVRWKRTLSSINPAVFKSSAVEVDDINAGFDPDAVMMRLFSLYMITLALILVVNRSHVLLRALTRRR